MARLLRRAALIAAALAACSGVAAPEPPRTSPAPTARGEPPETTPALPWISATAEPLDFETPPEARLRFLSGIAVEAGHSRWGGLSGLWVDERGERFLAASDRGTIFGGRFVREDGALRGVAELESWPMLGLNGKRLRAHDADAEGFDRGPDGALYVSLEGLNQVLRYPAPDAKPEPVAAPLEVDALQENSGLEALAAAPDGTLAMIPERSGDEARPFPVFLRAPDGAWSRGALRREPPFLVTDAAFAPGPGSAKTLYVLERDFSLLGWFRARLRRATLTEQGLGPDETLATLSGVDNMEALAVWRDAEGVTRLLIASDDNFNPLQRTIFLEFALPKDEARTPGSAEAATGSGDAPSGLSEPTPDLTAPQDAPDADSVDERAASRLTPQIPPAAETSAAAPPGRRLQ